MFCYLRSVLDVLTVTIAAPSHSRRFLSKSLILNESPIDRRVCFVYLRTSLSIYYLIHVAVIL